MSNVKFMWDGEKIKRQITESEQKFTPKDMLDSLHNVRNQINQMQSQKEQLKQQIEQLEKNLKDAKGYETKLGEFEGKCHEMQVEKLNNIINNIYKECKDKAQRDAEEIIAKDPEAYSEEQKKMMPYLNFQKALATHPKVAEKISQHIIRECLYDQPIFTNPFKD